MKQEKLRYFLVVSKYMNISRAAEELYVTQQALSKAIRRMEKDLGVSLFIRTAKGLQFTEYGNCFLPYARKIVRDIDTAIDAIEKIKMQACSIIKMGYVIGHFNTQSAVPPSVILRFENNVKNLTVHIEEHGPEELKQMILYDELDAAYIVEIMPKNSSDFAECILMQEKMFAMVSTHNPLSMKNIICMDDLKQQTLLMLSNSPVPETDISFIYKGTGYTPKIKYIEGSINHCVERVRMNEGFMFVGDTFAHTIDMEQLTVLPFSDNTTVLNHRLIYKSGKPLSPVLRLFLRTIAFKP